MSKKNTIRLTEDWLKTIISESVETVLNEIGDTRRGQYLLGKLYKRKRDDSWSEYAQNGDWESHIDNIDKWGDIQKYAEKHNTKGLSGDYAFLSGQNNKVIGTGFGRKTRPANQRELWDYYTTKDGEESQMTPDEIYKYSLEWLEKNSSKILKFNGGNNKRAKEVLEDENCDNLGELIRICPKTLIIALTRKFYPIFMKKMYKELNLYFEDSISFTMYSAFEKAWKVFCEKYQN